MYFIYVYIYHSLSEFGNLNASNPPQLHHTSNRDPAFAEANIDLDSDSA